MTVELPQLSLDRVRARVAEANFYRLKGKVTELTGLVVKAVIPGVKVGELCYIESLHLKKPIKAEVVGGAAAPGSARQADGHSGIQACETATARLSHEETLSMEAEVSAEHLFQITSPMIGSNVTLSASW